jgi:thiamine-monophosphate kinase
VNEAWLAPFASGLLALADEHQCELIGGDTTRGPLNICITVFGEVSAPHGRTRALLRSGARMGDDIYVSGHLGDARLALDVLRGRVQLAPQALARIRPRLERPTPRVALGLALCGIATSAIDISDGLRGDLGHILQASQVGALLQADALTTLVADTAAFASAHETASRVGAKEPLRVLDYVLAGGDDYELAFTAPPSARMAVAQAAQGSQTRVTRIGSIDDGAGLRVLDAHGTLRTPVSASFDHFA